MKKVVEQNLTLDGRVLHKTDSRANKLDVYMDADGTGDDETFYFVNGKNEVVFSLKVEADMSQGCGFISDWNIKEY